MPENMRYFGLCMSCRNASSCRFPRDPAKPAFYCEEFEIETKVSIIPPEEEPATGGLAIDSSAAKEKDSTEFIPSHLRRAGFTPPLGGAGFIGLCSDCEGRQTCAFPKPEGGVWHCEEYR